MNRDDLRCLLESLCRFKRFPLFRCAPSLNSPTSYSETVYGVQIQSSLLRCATCANTPQGRLRMILFGQFAIQNRRNPHPNVTMPTRALRSHPGPADSVVECPVQLPDGVRLIETVVRIIEDNQHVGRSVRVREAPSSYDELNRDGHDSGLRITHNPRRYCKSSPRSTKQYSGGAARGRCHHSGGPRHRSRFE